MMTLAQMAEFVTVKVNQTEVEDVVACKSFLQVHFRQIWADQLWKDSVVEYVQTLTPDDYQFADTWLPTKATLLLPSIIERVLAVRSADWHMNVQRPEFYYRRDFDSFSQQGTPIEFILLSPCVWETDESLSWVIYSTTTDDSGRVDYLAANGVDITRASSDNIQVPISFDSDRIDFLTANGVTVVTIAANPGGTLFTIGPGSGTLALHQRIKLVPRPTAEVVLRVLAKRTAPTFVEDDDTAALTGVDNVLLELAEGSMLERERQRETAQLSFQKGMLLLDQLKKQETVQQAFSQRFIPENGYADEYALAVGSPLAW